MQEISSMPRQVVFDAEFWPTMHTLINTRKATGMPLETEFYEQLAEALATLGTVDLSTLRLDFVRFPIIPDNVNVRTIRVGAVAMLKWSFQGAKHDAPFHAIAGARIVVSEIDLIDPATRSQ
jgi:hypothetical protein